MILHIMLGTACNWRCQYCLQLSQPKFNKPFDQQFPNKLRRYIIDNNITIDRIDYWGGEPCLYWDRIVSIHETIKDLGIGNVRFVTNGSLLTPPIVLWLNHYNVHVNLSYHMGQLTDEQWQLALQIKRISVTSLIHHQRLSWDPYFDKWNELIIKFGRVVPWFVFNLYNVECCDASFKLTKSDVDQYIDYLHNIAIPLSNNNVFYKRALQALFDVELSTKKYGTCACYNSNVLSIDTFGNIYRCHHAFDSQYKTSNIFDRSFKSITYINTLKQQCTSCKLFDICRGGCQRETDDVYCYFLHKLSNLREYIGEV